MGRQSKKKREVRNKMMSNRSLSQYYFRLNMNSYGMLRIEVLVDSLQVMKRTLKRKHLVFPLLPCR